MTPADAHAPADSSIVPIAMVRPHLDALPQAPLPAPYRLRWYEPGDERAWTAIWTLSDRINTITPALFADQFGHDAADIHRRQCYVIDAQGRAVGTATAWHPDAEHPATSGRVHWVAIEPAMQGRGLAKPLMCAILARMKELGYTGAFLTTESPRLVAIRMYLQLGFDPEPRTPRETEAWHAIRGQLSH